MEGMNCAHVVMFAISTRLAIVPHTTSETHVFQNAVVLHDALQHMDKQFAGR